MKKKLVVLAGSLALLAPSCQVAILPPPPGPPGLPDVATGGRTYAEVLREAERIAAIKDPAKRETARRSWEAEREREEVEIDWSLFGLGLLF